MPVRDGGRYLRAALDSVLGQTFDDFELLVVDDGSLDDTADILASVRDPRLRLLRNAESQGVTRSLNIGLQAARGTYVARMDADDLCAPDRLARQVAFLDAHPDHVLLGSSLLSIDAQGRVLRRRIKPMNDMRLRWAMLFRTVIHHPTAMFRRVMPDGAPAKYDESCAAAQDYELWLRLLQQGKGAILAEPLLSYREHPESVSAKKLALQKATIQRCSAAFIRSVVAPELADDELRALQEVYQSHLPAPPQAIAPAARALTRLRRAFEARFAPSRADRLWIGRYAAELTLEAFLRNARTPAGPLVLAAGLGRLPALGARLAELAALHARERLHGRRPAALLRRAEPQAAGAWR